MKRIAVVVVGLALNACRPAVTGLVVNVAFDPALGVDQLVFTLTPAGGTAISPVRAPATPAPLPSGNESAGFDLPDALGDVDVTVAVDALAGGAVVASGSSTAKTKRGDNVDVDVTVAALVRAACGDGSVDTPESCDDGNVDAGDGCDADCVTEVGWQCAGAPSVCQRCGDGVVQGDETCDDANFADGDGCSSACALEDGFVCTGTPNVCTAPCGDGNVAPGEACDDGNDFDGDGCSSACVVEPGYTCDDLAPSTCVTTCGDGVRAGSEGCDDHNGNDGDGCSSACVVETGFLCPGDAPSVCAPICGDGIVIGGEECDDGSDPVTGNSDTRGNACRASCVLPRCGDGVVDDDAAFGEECDDGNNTNRDGCNNGCRVPRCGDGFVEGTEACDDGNGADVDGCSSSCTVENGSVCGGEPSVCGVAALTHTVAPSGGDFAKPSAAAAAANDGDIIFIAAGAYSDHVDVDSKDLTFVAARGATITRNQGGGTPSETFLVEGNARVVVQGLTITNADNHDAVVVNDTATLSLVGCTVGPSPDFGVRAASGTTVSIERSLVLDNAHGGLRLGAGYLVESSVVIGNGGGGSGDVSVDLAGAGTFTFDTVTGNHGDGGHAGIQCAGATSIASSIAFGNSGSNVAASCGTSDTITSDPSFDVDGFHLRAGSFAIDGAGASCPARDVDGDLRPIGAACDFGADERPR